MFLRVEDTEMEGGSEELIGGSDDQAQIIKGRRTKRQRPCSPFNTGIISSCSSGGSTVGSGGGGGGGVFYSSIIPLSAYASSDEISTSAEEDEDMANCLILLAQGGKSDCFIQPDLSAAATTGTAVKVGLFVYECKTCNRTFQSFQALGGHRASHKKPRVSPPEGNKKEERQEERNKLHKIHELKREFSEGNNINNNNKQLPPKIHECLICGSVFLSGQALGGHMRRHRTPAATTHIQESTTTAPADKPRNVFALDLNLPAPEDDHLEIKYHQVNPNRQGLVLSATALVDCHY